MAKLLPDAGPGVKRILHSMRHNIKNLVRELPHVAIRSSKVEQDTQRELQRAVSC